MQHWLASVGVTVTVLAACLPITGREQRPNFILIMADDLGYGELGCYGQQWIRTPHIDRLAAEGIRFLQFYSGSPVCAPSRCVLLTGKHTGHSYIRDNGDPKDLQHLQEKFGWEFPGQHPLPASEVTLGELLHHAGYATAAIGKWGLGHFGTSGEPIRQGFDLFYGFNCQRHAHNHYPRFLWRNGQKEQLPGNDRTLHGESYSQDRFIDEALDFIRGHSSQPFFLYLPFAIPHLAIQVPEVSLAQYRGTIPEQEYQHRGYLRHPSPRAGYAAMITHLDQGVGQIMELLQDLGIDQNTLVLFTSDNGPTYQRLGGSDSEFFQSTAGLRGFKGSTYEGGLRVPLIVRWPDKIPAGRASDQLAAFWDILPTLCDLAGVKIPSDVDGLSLVPTLLDRPGQQTHEYLYWEFPSYGGQQAVRMGDWKAVRQRMFRGNRDIELYDLASDRSEQADVSNRHPEIVQRAAEIMESARDKSELFPLFRDS